MTRVALRGILGRKLRTVLTAFAIVLGVAMVSGSYVLTDSIQKAFHSLLSHLSNEFGGVVMGKHNGIPWFYVDDMAPQAVGYIPSFLREDDTRPIIEQINERYISGWHKFEGFQLMKKSWTIKFAGDPPLQPIAGAALHGEIIVVYPSAWVMIVKENNSYEIARMD